MSNHFGHLASLYLRNIFHSFSQVMLQKNASTGLFLLLGIALSSLPMLFGSILAVVSGLAVAKLCNFNAIAVQSGIYGYNAALVGIAVLYFFPLSFISMTLALFGGVFSTLITHLMLTKLTSIPVFTTPFILTTWFVLLFIDYTGLITVVQGSLYETSLATFNDYLKAVLRGIAQVMLQDYWLTGVIFLCALAIYSIKSAIWALIGSTAGVLMACGLNYSQEMVILGVYGFNGSLVAIALSERYSQRYCLIILGILVSVLLTSAFESVSLPALTTPFVLATWFMMSFIKIGSRFTLFNVT
jgi:urea transporter